MANLDSAFWFEDFGFLIDRTDHAVASVAGMEAFRDCEIAEKLEASGRLPDLSGAPVASWLLPRLVEITRGGIQLDDQERIRNDGGCVYLRWLAFTKTLKLARSSISFVIQTESACAVIACQKQNPRCLLRRFLAHWSSTLTQFGSGVYQ